MLTNQVFKASNQAHTGQRPVFVRQGGTEFYRVRPVDQNNNPEVNPLQALVNG